MQYQNANQPDDKPPKKSQILPAANQQISQDLPVPKTVDTSQVDITTPQTAADDDLIEKEWVEKVKEVVEKTRLNPYQRQEELAKVKADYLKKRYGKEVHPLDG